MFLFLFCIAINISFAGSESDFEFTSYTDKKIGKYIVITKYTGNSAKCEISEKIGNYPVLEIYCRDSLFAPKNKITELILPNSLKKIGANAFKNNHLTKLDFPSNVDYIFENGEGLSSHTWGIPDVSSPTYPNPVFISNCEQNGKKHINSKKHRYW